MSINSIPFEQTVGKRGDPKKEFDLIFLRKTVESKTFSKIKEEKKTIISI